MGSSELGLPWRIVVVHDDIDTRNAMRKVLEAIPDLALVSETSEVSDCASLVYLMRPDIVVVGGEIPGVTDAIRSITASPSELVVVTLGSTDEAVCRPLFRAGALANADIAALEKLPETIRRALRLRTELGYRP